jgi:hypothetical protein
MFAALVVLVPAAVLLTLQYSYRAYIVSQRQTATYKIQLVHLALYAAPKQP